MEGCFGQLRLPEQSPMDCAVYFSQFWWLDIQDHSGCWAPGETSLPGLQRPTSLCPDMTLPILLDRDLILT